MHFKIVLNRLSGFQENAKDKVPAGIWYNLNIMRQSACLVFNQIMVDNYAAFFNCTLVCRASDSMMAPT